MYKLLLSWRYLRTRFLALASIVSVMLGVGTLIVVNSVMSGFSTKMMDRIRGVQADIVIEHRSPVNGMRQCAGHVQAVRRILGDRLLAVAPVIETFGMAEFRFQHYRDEMATPVRIVGIDPAAMAQTGDFAKALQNADHRADPTKAFTLSGQAREFYETHLFPSAPSGFGPAPQPRPDLGPGALPSDGPPQPDPPTPPPEEVRVFGAVVGYGVAHFRQPGSRAGDEDREVRMLYLGDELSLMMPSCTDAQGYDGRRSGLRPVLAKFVVTDYFKSDMSEIDGKIVYIHINDMQRLRGMTDRATSLHIRLRDPDRDSADAVAALRAAFDENQYSVKTWKERQGPIIAAIATERAILNVLLFLIIAVAGFGILAIFFMIVVEKTRDIGILKSLGASSRGVMGVFLGYGLTLGLVGAGLGTIGGVAFTIYINEIEQFLTRVTGQEVFDRSIYYFDKIPTDLQPMTILGVNLGAVLIAVSASVFPSLRAALLHPVRALRFE
jgi:lipoprotein-releasing system permease protein